MMTNLSNNNKDRYQVVTGKQITNEVSQELKDPCIDATSFLWIIFIDSSCYWEHGGSVTSFILAVKVSECLLLALFDIFGPLPNKVVFVFFKINSRVTQSLTGPLR